MVFIAFMAEACMKWFQLIANIKETVIKSIYETRPTKLHNIYMWK